ncbi:MAG TPA: acetoin utilization protein AcuC, partial [Arthrobacter sp.]|nr:acetoin utilization protein AcuC [Arthrobacter sp.]
MTFQSGLSLPALPTTVVWDAAMTAYNFGPGHPMAPDRLDLTARLARGLGLLDLDHVT